MTSDATIRDVAKQAKVSTAMVSRVLNNSPAVSQETRRRVQEAIQKLDYRPISNGRRHASASPPCLETHYIRSKKHLPPRWEISPAICAYFPRLFAF